MQFFGKVWEHQGKISRCKWKDRQWWQDQFFVTPSSTMSSTVIHYAEHHRSQLTIFSNRFIILGDFVILEIGNFWCNNRWTNALCGNCISSSCAEPRSRSGGNIGWYRAEIRGGHVGAEHFSWLLSLGRDKGWAAGASAPIMKMWCLPFGREWQWGINGPPPVHLLIAFFCLFAAVHQLPSTIMRRTMMVCATKGQRHLIDHARCSLELGARNVIGQMRRWQQGGSTRCERECNNKGEGQMGEKTTHRWCGEDILDKDRGGGNQHDLDILVDGSTVGRRSGGGSGFFFVGFGWGIDLRGRVIGVCSNNCSTALAAAFQQTKSLHFEESFWGWPCWVVIFWILTFFFNQSSRKLVLPYYC